MQNEALFLISTLMVIGSLFVVSAINRRQTRYKLKEAVFNKLKRRASEVVELEIMVEPLLEGTSILKILNEEVIHIIDKMRQIFPENHFIDIGQTNAEQRKEVLNDPDYDHFTNRFLDGAAAIARAQHALNETATIIRKQQAEGFIELGQMELYIRELSWAHLMVSVITYVTQGHKMININDAVRAHAFYKKALEHATQSGHSDQRQNRYISEIGELMNRKRMALSEDLMPENEFNPQR